MTLIVTAGDKTGKYRYVAASDILITDNFLDAGNKENLPFQFGLSVDTSATIGRKILSKSVIFGNYLLLWAGYRKVADELIKRTKRICPKNGKEFINLAENLLHDIKSGQVLYDFKYHQVELSAILSHNDGTLIWDQGFQTRLFDNGKTRILAAGTGTDDFIDSIRKFRSFNNEVVSASVLPVFFDLFVSEVTDRIDFPLSGFGGGYEFFGTAKNGGFRRLSYSICEVSRFDHARKKIMPRFHVSRIIQCNPVKNGTVFQTISPACSISGHRPLFKQFFAYESDAPECEIGHIIEMKSFDFGTCSVFSERGLTILSEKPFGYYNSISNELHLEIKEIEVHLDDYLHGMGYDTSLFPSSLCCSHCRSYFPELNYFVDYDENGALLQRLIICDRCSLEHKSKP